MEVANPPSANRRYTLLTCLGLAGAALAVHAAAAPALGSLLITLPDSEIPQRLDLDNPQRLTAHADGNAKGARFYGGNSHYYKIQNVGFKQDAFSAFSSATGRLEYVARSIPRVRDVQAAPTAAGVFSFVFLDVTGDTGLFTIVDLSREQRVLASYKGEVGQYLHWWMPDGSIRRLHARTGELSAWRGSLQGANERMAWETVGVIAPPSPDTIFGMASLSPSGDELMLATVEDRTRRVDLWVAGGRDARLQRVTNDGFVSFVTWAPDGRHFLFQRNNVSAINTSIQGQCSYWVAPSTARNVTAIVPGVPNPAVRQVVYGSPQSPTSLPCGQVAAWLK